MLAVLSRAWTSVRSAMLVIGAVTAAACKGSIEGTVFGTDAEPRVRLTDHSVFLVETSPDVASALDAACPANAPDWPEKVRGERQRFDQIATAYTDSARDELARRRGRLRWSALIRMMNLYRDSAARMDGRPPPIPRDLIEKLATKRVNTGDDGRYGFVELPRGTYLVATEVRDEYRWVSVQVARGRIVADITPSRSQTSCDVARVL